MKKILLLLFIPAFSFADRLGSLNSNAQVSLSTQVVILNSTQTITGENIFTSTAGIHSNTLISQCANWDASGNLNGSNSACGSGSSGGVSVYPATATVSFPFGGSASTFTVTSTLTANALTITGTGWPSFTANDGNTYNMAGSSSTPVTVGHTLVYTSTNGATGDSGSSGGGGGGSPGGSSGQIQYNSGGSFAGVPSVVTASSITIISSMSITSTGNQNSTPGFFDVYDGHAFASKVLWSFGSQNQNNQIRLLDQTPLDLTRYGADVGSLVVGAVGSSAGHVIFDANNIQNQIDFWNNGDMDLETTTNGNGGGNINFLAGATTEVAISTLGVTISTNVILNGSSGTNGQVFTSNGAGAGDSWTTVSGGGSSLVLFSSGDIVAPIFCSSNTSPSDLIYLDTITIPGGTMSVGNHIQIWALFRDTGPVNDGSGGQYQFLRLGSAGIMPNGYAGDWFIPGGSGVIGYQVMQWDLTVTGPSTEVGYGQTNLDNGVNRPIMPSDQTSSYNYETNGAESIASAINVSPGVNLCKSFGGGGVVSVQWHVTVTR